MNKHWEPLQLSKPIKVVSRTPEWITITFDGADKDKLLERLAEAGFEIRMDYDGSLAAHRNPERLKDCKPLV